MGLSSTNCSSFSSFVSGSRKETCVVGRFLMGSTDTATSAFSESKAPVSKDCITHFSTQPVSVTWTS